MKTFIIVHIICEHTLPAGVIYSVCIFRIFYRPLPPSLTKYIVWGAFLCYNPCCGLPSALKIPSNQHFHYEVSFHFNFLRAQKKTTVFYTRLCPFQRHIYPSVSPVLSRRHINYCRLCRYGGIPATGNAQLLDNLLLKNTINCLRYSESNLSNKRKFVSSLSTRSQSHILRK